MDVNVSLMEWEWKDLNEFKWMWVQVIWKVNRLEWNEVVVNVSLVEWEWRIWMEWLVNIKSLILYFGLKFGLKYNKNNNNKVCSFRYN